MDVKALNITIKRLNKVGQTEFDFLKSALTGEGSTFDVRAVGQILKRFDKLDEADREYLKIFFARNASPVPPPPRAPRKKKGAEDADGTIDETTDEAPAA